MAMREVSCGERMKWTKEADNLISQRHLTAKDLAETLGITPHAVYQRRSRLGITFHSGKESTPGYRSRWPRTLKYIKKWILQRDEFICFYCGQPANEVDHVIPKHHGGSDAPSNLVASCKRCNNLKGTSCSVCPAWRNLIESA